jgi:AcrR family transcriptional regulator
MQAREMGVERTRERILEAARSLHAEQGIGLTNYEEIAHRAETSTATVYRHFPNLASLLPACADSIQVLRPATPLLAEQLFAGLDQPAQRIEVLVRGTCECYRRDGGWLAAARGEERSIEALRDIARTQAANLRLLSDAALEGLQMDGRRRQRIAALIDFPVWQSLKAAGFSEEEAEAEMLHLVMQQVDAS